MLPPDLKPEHFAGYPPEARKLAANYIGLFRHAPLSFLPSLLREVAEYDYKFPAERKSLEAELNALAKVSGTERDAWFQPFVKIRLSSALENSDWVNAPAQFVEQMSAHLWTTHQTDAFRSAAMEFADRVRAASPPDPPVVPRLGISVIGEGVADYREPVFRRLRPHGAYFTGVNPQCGLAQLLEIVSARAKAHPIPYAHWYVDGGQSADHDATLTCVSYAALEPARSVLSGRMRKQIEIPGMGPEALRTLMAKWQPADLGISGSDPVLERFQLKILTEGSGTQIFSTTFAQWTAREALRRAQPLTMLVRFAPRQRQRPMNDLLYRNSSVAEPDPVGSLVDGDMGAYYNWLNQQRLSGSETAAFVAWFEGHDQAVAIGPTTPRGTVSNSPMDVKQLLTWAS